MALDFLTGIERKLIAGRMNIPTWVKLNDPYT
jgi:hypothetical protein